MLYPTESINAMKYDRALVSKKAELDAEQPELTSVHNRLQTTHQVRIRLS